MYVNQGIEKPTQLQQPSRVSRSLHKPLATSTLVLLALLLVAAAAAAGTGLWWYYSGKATARTRPQSEALSRTQPGNENAGAQSSEHLNRSEVFGASTVDEEPPAERTSDDTFLDSDNDRLRDSIEELYQTDPNNPDFDGDGHRDGSEVEMGYEPRNPSRGVRMVDLALVDRIAQSGTPIVISSGVSIKDHNRYYLLFDGTSSSYYGADGTLVAQCPLGVEPVGSCNTIPNEIRTDFSRMFDNGTFTDSYHVPF